MLEGSGKSFQEAVVEVFVVIGVSATTFTCHWRFEERSSSLLNRGRAFCSVL